MSKTHIAGLTLLMGNRYQRQRCAWCGEVLIDYDLENTMVAPGGSSAIEPRGWELNALVRVDGRLSTVAQPRADGRPPKDTCFYDDHASPLDQN